MTRPLMTLIATCLSGIVLAGCSGSVQLGSTTVDKGDLDAQVARSITPDEAGSDVTADCAGDLEGKVGAQQECHVVVGDENADVRLKVTSVDGDKVKWDTTAFLPAERVADTIRTNLEGQGYGVDSITCAGELYGEVGDSTTCTATGPKVPADLTADVTSVDGLLINFNYKSK